MEFELAVGFGGEGGGLEVATKDGFSKAFFSYSYGFSYSFF